MVPIKATLRSMLLIMPALALAIPAFAQTRSAKLSDSQEPGSVIVFPKFINAPAVSLQEGGTAPASALKIGVVCPKNASCTSDQEVTIRLHWVCGASAANPVCDETNFEVTATVFEKIILVPDGTPEDGYKTGLPTKSVPAAPCPGGYLIGWVIDSSTLQPIKFDGLIGSADLRDVGPGDFFGVALASYPAIPIQADPALANGAAITTSSAGGLVFDGGAGHYQAVTGRVFGNARYTLPDPVEFGGPGTHAFLTLLTLDVMSNRPNNPVFVDLDFFGGNPSTIGNENQTSTSTNFICWEEVVLDAISAGLTTTQMGLEGVFTSAPAQTAAGSSVTLLGIVTTWETFINVADAVPLRHVLRETLDTLSNDSVPVPTTFVPHP
jgi:hypothetical protein